MKAVNQIKSNQSKISHRSSNPQQAYIDHSTAFGLLCLSLSHIEEAVVRLFPTIAKRRFCATLPKTLLRHTENPEGFKLGPNPSVPNN
jgi:hypothetical protein